MRLNRLDLNLLIALDALLDEASVSRAAERVFLSQPAMSNALARLRAHFGDQLIVPIGRRMMLTELGISMKGEVRDVMLRIQRLTDTAQGFDAKTEARTFSLAASDYFVLVALPRVLAYCAVHAPAIRFDIHPLSGRLSDELDRGDIDLLIVPDVFASPAHPKEELFADHWVCMIDRSSALAGIELDRKAYLDAEHVVKRENNAHFPPMEEWVFNQQGIVRRVAVRVPQYGLLPPCLVGTERIATVQSRLADLYAAWLPLAIRPVPITIDPLLEMMQWHSYRQADFGNQWLREMVKLTCADLRQGAADASVR